MTFKPSTRDRAIFFGHRSRARWRHGGAYGLLLPIGLIVAVAVIVVGVVRARSH
jgi:hypothetical protein